MIRVVESPNSCGRERKFTQILLIIFLFWYYRSLRVVIIFMVSTSVKLWSTQVPLLNLVYYEWFNPPQCRPNTLKLRQNGCHIEEEILKHISLIENYCIMILISLNIVPRGPINIKPILIQTKAWHGTGKKSLSEPVMASFTGADMHQLASMT